jgi:hypothetical protein
METQKVLEDRIIDLSWRDAIATIQKVVQDKMTDINNDASISPDEQTERVARLEKAWQRILVG